MKIINPTGKKIIEILDSTHQKIVLEDFSNESTNFELEVLLKGEAASCEIIGRAQTTGAVKKIWKITQRFQGKNQTGNINVRGVAEDKSFLHIDGAAVIEQNSSQATAEISEKIMLFEHGKGKLIPVLRVETDDVAGAGHAASMSPVSAESLLYFASRGIVPTQAKAIVKEGFLKI